MRPFQCGQGRICSLGCNPQVRRLQSQETQCISFTFAVETLFWILPFPSGRCPPVRSSRASAGWWCKIVRDGCAQQPVSVEHLWHERLRAKPLVCTRVLAGWRGRFGLDLTACDLESRLHLQTTNKYFAWCCLLSRDCEACCLQSRIWPALWLQWCPVHQSYRFRFNSNIRACVKYIKHLFFTLKFCLYWC